MSATNTHPHNLRQLIKLCLIEPPASLLKLAPLIMRLMLGYGFMAHGLAKFFRGADSFALVLESMHLPAPHLLSWITIGIEVFGGLAIVLGAFITLVSIPMIIVLLVAVFTVHLPYGFSSIKLLAVTPACAQFGPPGYETDLLYAAGLVALVIGGPGHLALDTWFRRNLNSRN